jgi:signal transduction histidine kinase
VNDLPDLIGLGLYSVPEAARLAEVAPARVRGWVHGYREGPGKPRRAAVVGHVLPDVEGKTALSFRELIEVRFIRHFLRAGVSWRNIRQAAAQARRNLLSETGHRLRFSTDGVTIFADTLARSGDRKALDLVAHQYVMLHVLAQSIRSEFDLEAEDVIRAWHPRPEMPLVLLDPRRSFGHPIVEPGVPTQALADALRAEGGDAGRVAALFGTSEDAVRQAAAFEITLAA